MASDHDGHTINIGVPDHVGLMPDVTDAMRERWGDGAVAYNDGGTRICDDIVLLLDEVDRLRERNLAYARDLAALRAVAEAGAVLALAHSYRRMTPEHWRDLRDALVVAGHGPEADR